LQDVGLVPWVAALVVVLVAGELEELSMPVQAESTGRGRRTRRTASRRRPRQV